MNCSTVPRLATPQMRSPYAPIVVQRSATSTPTFHPTGSRATAVINRIVVVEPPARMIRCNVCQGRPRLRSRHALRGDGMRRHYIRATYSFVHPYCRSTDRRGLRWPVVPLCSTGNGS